MTVEIGKIAIKTAGRERGKKCVIIDIIDKNFVLVTGPKELTKVRRRRVNISHLRILPEKIEVKKGASDKEVLEALEKAGMLEYMKK